MSYKNLPLRVHSAKCMYYVVPEGANFSVISIRLLTGILSQENWIKFISRGQSPGGQRAYRGLVLFKVLLVGVWYGLSDERTEDMVNENLSLMRFCGLKLEDEVPDHSTLSRFRSELTAKRSFDRLLRKFNAQLKSQGMMLNSGKAKVDASLTDSPRSPKGRKTYEIAEDRKEDERSEEELEKEENQHRLIKKTSPGVDPEGRWVKKSGDLRFGYKRHISTDEDGLVDAVHTTAANEHASKGFMPVLYKVPKEKKKEVWADKAYQTPDNIDFLEKENIKNRIQQKAYRNRPLTHWQKLRNLLISKQRYKVDRTFGSMKRLFYAGTCRYVGLEKTHTQHVLETIAYNLKRSPGLARVRCVP